MAIVRHSAGASTFIDDIRLVAPFNRDIVGQSSTGFAFFNGMFDPDGIGRVSGVGLQYTYDATEGIFVVSGGTVTAYSYPFQSGGSLSVSEAAFSASAIGRYQMAVETAVSLSEVLAAADELRTVILAGNDQVFGSGVNDTLNGASGDDTLFGGSGNDTLQGGAGRDRLDGGIGDDVLDGGLGDDRYILDGTGDLIVNEVAFGSGGGIDTVITSVDFTAPANVEILRAQAGIAGIDLTGNDGPNTLVGNDLANRLEGRGGNDLINGNAGTDTLVGGEAVDTLVGGTGADTFVYLAVSNSRAGIANRDVLNGFDRGATQDLIDLSAIDANSVTAANDAFTFIGNAAFSAVGQVRIQSLGGPNAVIVEVNVNGDLAADMQIFVNQQTTMLAGDFVL